MTWCANGSVTCDECGHFCRPVDSSAPFGGVGPEGLTPPDDEHVCGACWPVLKARWAATFARGSKYGDWHKSRAEIEAAAEAGLEWVHTTGFVDSRTGRDIHYQYIIAADKEHFVPYLQWHREHRRSLAAAPTQSPEVTR